MESAGVDSDIDALGPVRRLDGAQVAMVVMVVVGLVLRFWDLGHGRLSIDESYTALAARMPVGTLIHHIDSTDPHPPLGYLIFQPIASSTTSTWWLRVGAALASSLALCVLAWWQRRRGVAGAVAVGVFALSSYQLAYGREMRMYGFVCLAGVVTAWAAEQWLREGGRRWIAAAAVAATACAFLHATGVILLVALAAVPLLRRDRSAWELRAAAAAGIVLFAALWGAHAVTWAGEPSAYPKGSLSWLSIVVNEMVAAVPANRWIVLPLVAIGGVLVVQRRDASSRVLLVLAVAPVAVLFLASIRQGVLIPKSVMAYSWAPAVALGAVCGAAWRRSSALGVGSIAAIALLILPYAHLGVAQDEGAGPMLRALDARVATGDAIGVQSERRDIRDLIQWYRSVVPGVEVSMDDSVPDLHLMQVAGEAPSGRIWLVTAGDQSSVDGYVPCGPTENVDGSYRVTCLAQNR